MKIQGSLLKMITIYSTPVDYYLELENEKIHLNNLIGKQLKLSYLGAINCIKCGRKTTKSFHQGYCYPCYMTAPETSECVLKPELCRAHEGISRDMEWSKEHCLQDHFVYLALTSGLKVGVTRKSQIPTRWIDQGAIQAIKIAQTPNRFLAGQIEVDLKKYFDDKTNWRNMLVNKTDREINLLDQKKKAYELVQKRFKQYFIESNDITEIQYPVIEFPEKVNSIDLEKTIVINNILKGIKGQYLLFSEGQVINIRKYNGYKIELEY
ncbi:MAG: hypothetical protein A2W99_14895 [Bacteroidetes bacterium GWF2_33_16]|nr:MAG: hypothetical protein A2X00_00190 [Bacteroidetes bacterium GWE2_32_14]OFY07615.1 MAG: hypothetical protein A2W99_14895 [Bacteroidetes bacterium GWF2_33_16]